MKSLSFGEILWDIIRDQECLGGASLNLAAHLAKLGNDSWVVSAVGDDPRGQKIIEKSKEAGVKSELIQISKNFPTGYVTVDLNETGQPTFEIHENVAYDNIKNVVLPENNFELFCFGTLVQRNKISRDSLFDLIKKIKPRHIFYDVNLRQNYFSKEIIKNSLNRASIVKLNDDEVKILSPLLFNKNLEEKDFAEKIIDTYGLKIAIITRGANGGLVVENNNSIEFPGIKVEVSDTVGAGDAFSAGFLHEYFKTNNLEKSAIFANKLGSFVASQQGAIPEYTPEIKQLLNI
jgi:fructokinase